MVVFSKTKNFSIKSNILVTSFALAAFSAPISQAEGISSQEKTLMGQVVRSCKWMPKLSSPRPSVGSDRDAQDFVRYKEWFDRDMKKLSALNPDPQEISFKVQGKPFNKQLEACRQKINDNKSALNEHKENTPSPRVIQLAKEAIWRCDITNKWIDSPESYNADYSSIVEGYNYYKNSRDQAVSLDRRVLDWNNAKLKHCDDNFVPKFLALQSKVEERVRLAEQKEKMERQKAQNARVLAAQEKQRQRQAKADELGYKHLYDGIEGFIANINSSAIPFSEAKDYAILNTGYDPFKVNSIDNQNVIYGKLSGSGDFIQVATPREAGKFYGENTELPYGYYSVSGILEFVTVLGARKQILKLKLIAESK